MSYKYQEMFHRFCVESCASISTVLLPQLKTHCQMYKIRINFKEDSASFSFGESIHQNCGTLISINPLNNVYFMKIPLSMVKIDIPFLFGLDIIRKHHLILDYN